jgi:hypothetical protein
MDNTFELKEAPIIELPGMTWESCDLRPGDLAIQRSVLWMRLITATSCLRDLR